MDQPRYDETERTGTRRRGNLWSQVARLGRFLARPAAGDALEEPLAQVERAAREAAATCPWGGRPFPEGVALLPRVPHRPDFEALDPRAISGAARRAAEEVLAARFGHRCGIKVEEVVMDPRLAEPRIELRLRPTRAMEPSIRRAVVRIDYADRRSHPSVQKVLADLDRFSIGTDPTMEVRIGHDATGGVVSRRHCWAQMEGGRLMVRDGHVTVDETAPGGAETIFHESTNGTAVDGHRLEEPGETVQWALGGKLVLAPSREDAGQPASSPDGQGVTLWLLELEP